MRRRHWNRRTTRDEEGREDAGVEAGAAGVVGEPRDAAPARRVDERVRRPAQTGSSRRPPPCRLPPSPPRPPPHGSPRRGTPSRCAGREAGAGEGAPARDARLAERDGGGLRRRAAARRALGRRRRGGGRGGGGREGDDVSGGGGRTAAAGQQQQRALAAVVAAAVFAAASPPPSPPPKTLMATPSGRSLAGVLLGPEDTTWGTASRIRSLPGEHARFFGWAGRRLGARSAALVVAVEPFGPFFFATLFARRRRRSTRLQEPLLFILLLLPRSRRPPISVPAAAACQIRSDLLICLQTAHAQPVRCPAGSIGASPVAAAAVCARSPAPRALLLGRHEPRLWRVPTRRRRRSAFRPGFKKLPRCRWPAAARPGSVRRLPTRRSTRRARGTRRGAAAAWPSSPSPRRRGGDGAGGSGAPPCTSPSTPYASSSNGRSRGRFFFVQPHGDEPVAQAPPGVTPSPASSSSTAGSSSTFCRHPCRPGARTRCR